MSSEILGEFLWPKEIQTHVQQCGDDRVGRGGDAEGLEAINGGGENNIKLNWNRNKTNPNYILKQNKQTKKTR